VSTTRTTGIQLQPTRLQQLAAAGQDYAKVTDVAAIYQTDRRTILRRIEEGRIPATNVAGDWRIPVWWLVEQMQAVA